MKSKIPMRMCVGCNEKQPKGEMLRIVRTPEGEIHIDATGRMNGRGCYVCGKAQCMNAIIKQKKLNKSFEMTVDADVYEALTQEFQVWLNNGGSNIG